MSERVAFCESCGSAVWVEEGNIGMATAFHENEHIRRGTTAAVIIYDSELEAEGHYKGVLGFFNVERFIPPTWTIPNQIGPTI